ncbi:thiol:disulfide interchange protein DsbA/DsbL [Novilysobacter erysipheiresistens]|uniref:Thiol:disulfide interchange protein DsbA/DsbL n=1 Tax=Novilysobacter erysipheiresistens TaxID=1749332 RepID=A0ABU7Z045_9GAMM
MPLSLPALNRVVLAAVLFVLAPFAALAQSPGNVPVAGVDYVEIAGGEPFAAAPGKIEVVEVFGYTCIHCAHFEPLVSAWKAGLPDDVSFVPVPAPFGGYWVPYAQAFHAAQELGLLDRTHAAMFRALHETGSLPIANATAAEIAGFYAGYGADPGQFAKAMASDATAAKLERARGFLRRSGVEGTPTLIVAGRYRVTADSFQELLDIAGALIERERARRRR